MFEGPNLIWCYFPKIVSSLCVLVVGGPGHDLAYHCFATRCLSLIASSNILVQDKALSFVCIVARQRFGMVRESEDGPCLCLSWS